MGGKPERRERVLPGMVGNLLSCGGGIRSKAPRNEV